MVGMNSIHLLPQLGIVDECYWATLTRPYMSIVDERYFFLHESFHKNCQRTLNKLFSKILQSD